MSGQEILDEIADKAKKIEDARVYFALRQRQQLYITVDSIKAIKIFIAARQMGIRMLTTSLFAALMQKTSTDALAQLHRLGDKRIITLVRDLKRKEYRYMIPDEMLILIDPSLVNGDRNVPA